MESAWTRVSGARRCPVCGKPDWCLVSSDASAAICPRTPSKNYIDGSGYLHVLKESKDITPRKYTPKPLPEHSSIIHQIHMSLKGGATQERLQSLGESLGVSVESLRALYVGFSESKNSYSFPMTRAGRRMLGIRFRSTTGSKFSARGGKEGLFIPSTFTKSKAVVICEGPTDTAALLDLGFNAIGRPSCLGGARLIEELIGRLPVAIFADSDGPGKSGAELLKKRLLKTAPPKTPVVFWSEGFDDARQMVANGASKTDVMDLINKAKNEQDC